MGDLINVNFPSVTLYDKVIWKHPNENSIELIFNYKFKGNINQNTTKGIMKLALHDATNKTPNRNVNNEANEFILIHHINNTFIFSICIPHLTGTNTVKRNVTIGSSLLINTDYVFKLTISKNSMEIIINDNKTIWNIGKIGNENPITLENPIQITVTKSFEMGNRNGSDEKNCQMDTCSIKNLLIFEKSNKLLKTDNLFQTYNLTHSEIENINSDYLKGFSDIFHDDKYGYLVPNHDNDNIIVRYLLDDITKIDTLKIVNIKGFSKGFIYIKIMVIWYHIQIQN